MSDEQKQEEARTQDGQPKAPAVEVPEPQMATAEDLRGAGNEFIHELPNGKAVRMRTITLSELISCGHLPGELVSFLVEAEERYGDRDLGDLKASDLSGDEQAHWFTLLRHAACLAVVEPRIVPTREEAIEDPAAIYVGDMDDAFIVDIGARVFADRRGGVVPFGASSLSLQEH